jgi:hypothetical protein
LKVENDGATLDSELKSSAPADTAIFNSPFSIVNSGEAAGEPLIWLIAPSPDGQCAAVEFAEVDSATFVFRVPTKSQDFVGEGGATERADFGREATEEAERSLRRRGGDFDRFAKQLNRALEAINFKREVIRLSNEELRKPENADYYMAAKRTAALQFVRANFEGRVIHSSADSWKRKLTELWNSTAAKADMAQIIPVTSKPTFCGQCGAELAPGVKFCGTCGASQTNETT